jgi:transcriptional regulatory protein LevR
MGDISKLEEFQYNDRCCFASDDIESHLNNIEYAINENREKMNEIIEKQKLEYRKSLIFMNRITDALGIVVKNIDKPTK